MYILKTNRTIETQRIYLRYNFKAFYIKPTTEYSRYILFPESGYNYLWNGRSIHTFGYNRNTVNTYEYI